MSVDLELAPKSKRAAGESFGPELAAGEWKDFWVYVAGPLICATRGALAYQLVRGHPGTTKTKETAADGARPVRLPA